MKAIVNRARIEEASRAEEERKLKDMQRRLQNIENDFARCYGFESRTVVYAPFDTDLNRELMIDYMTEKYYPLNLEMGLTKEEFRAEVVQQTKDAIENHLRAMEQSTSGYFKKHVPDKVFLFSNNLKHNMIPAKNTLEHESLHAGIFDLITGKIPVLRTYQRKEFDDKFFLNLVTELKMKALVNNRNEMILPPVGNPSSINQYYSFEENFVMFNTLCAMLDQELQTTNLNVDNILEIFSLYLGSSGVEIKPVLDNKVIELYGKQVCLKDYLPTYYKILRGSIEDYDEKDKTLVGVIEPFNIEDIHFEFIDSKIPELVEIITNQIFSGHSSKSEIKQTISEFCEKYKIKG